MTSTRRTVLGAVTVSVLALTLSACAPQSDAQPDPTPTSTQAPAPADDDVEVTAAPSPAPVVWQPAPVQDGILTPSGTTLLAPARKVAQGEVTGWYAALEVAAGTPTQSVVDEFVTQLSALALSVTSAPEPDGSYTVSATGATQSVVLRYDITISPATESAPGTVTLLSASEPLPAPTATPTPAATPTPSVTEVPTA